MSLEDRTLRHYGLLLCLLIACESEPPAPPIPVAIDTPISMKHIREVSASSTLSYKGTEFGPRNAFDAASETAWCEGAKGIKGDWMKFSSRVK